MTVFGRDYRAHSWLQHSRGCPKPLDAREERLKRCREWRCEDDDLAFWNIQVEYLNPQDPLYFAAGGKSVSISDYSLELARLPPVEGE